MRISWLNKVVYYGWIILLLNTGCAARHSYTVLNEEAPPQVCDLYFVKDSTRFFRTSVETYGKTLSGILVAKKVNNDTLKVTFLSDMGLKFFDLEIYQGSYRLMYSIPQINSEAVMNTLVQDISTFLLWPYRNLNHYKKVNLQGENDKTVLRYEYGEEYLLYIFNQEKIEKIIHVYAEKVKGDKRRSKEKYEITYSNYQEGIPAKVNIRHQKFKLRIDLSVLERI